jgi:signal transduction histidine kinase
MDASPLPTHSDVARPEAEVERDRLEPTAAQLAEQVTKRLSAEEMVRRYAMRLEHLQRMSLALLSADSLATVIQIAVQYVEETIACRAAGISLYDSRRAEALIVASSGNQWPAGARLPVTMTDVLAVMNRGNIYVFDDVQALAADSPALRQLAGMGGRSVLCVPVRAGETLLGGLWIAAAEVRPFTTEEVTIAREVCDLVAVAIHNRRLLEAEQKVRDRERSLREVGASLTLGLDLDEVLQRILAQLERLIPFSSAAIVLLDGRRLAFMARGDINVDRQQLDTVRERMPPNLQHVFDSCQPSLMNDTATDEGWSSWPGFDYIRAWLAAPLLLKGECIGALTIDRDQPHSFTAEDVELTLAFANQAAVAIDNARLFNEVQTHAERLDARVRERTRELEALYGITAAAIEYLDLDRVLARALELAVQAVGCPGGAIYLVQPGQPGLRPAALIGPGASGPLGETPFNGLLARFSPDGAPWIAGGRRATYDQSTGPLPQGLFAAGTQAAAVAPLRAHGRSLGVLALWSDTADAFDGASLLLTAIADQIGAAVENMQLRQMTRQAAIIEERERLARDLHDAVTQTVFSAGLFAEAARESARAGDLVQVERYSQAVVQRVYQALGEMRLLLFELRTETLAQLGLAGALRDRLNSVEERANIATRLSVEGVGSLPLALEETFYRVALEALNNTLRHAHAQRVSVTLITADGQLTLVVRDDGVGFRRRDIAQHGGMGLDSMAKRIHKVGGSIRIVSRPGRGTRVEARAPLAQATREGV